MPVRIQLSRRAGWRMPPNTVKVDRSTKWGNPYQGDGKDPNRAMLARLYREYMAKSEQSEKREAARAELRGKNLACWCPLDAPRHADVLLELANAEPSA